jgi:hypothetical protein
MVPGGVRPAEVILGGVFLVGALLKALDVNRFAVQITYYGVVARPDLVSLVALGTPGVETFLGMALLLRLRLRGMTFAAVLGLLAVFTGLIAYGWAFHGLKDCGCFGPIEMSPEVSIAKNVLLGVLAAIGWSGYWKNPLKPANVKVFCVQGMACAVLACAVALYSLAHLEKVKESERPFAQFVFEVDGVPYDLGKGEYFVAMLSMTCEHCMASVPALNDLTNTPGFPPVVALCYEEKPGALEDFQAQTSPIFPLYSLGDRLRTFFSFVGQEPPRFYLVRDGNPVAHWDETVPEVQDVLAITTSS